MIHFFRDILDGPIYIIVVIISLIIIMGIIGFIMERYQKEKEEESVVKTVNTSKPQASSTLVISSTTKPEQSEPVNEIDSGNVPIADPSPSTPISMPNPLPTVEISNVKETPPTEPIAVVPTIIETPTPVDSSNMTKSVVLELNSNDLLSGEQKPEVVEKTTPSEQSITNVAPVIDFGSTTDIEVTTK